MHVVRDRAGRVDETVAGAPRAPAEIHVLEVHEEALVEEADAVEHGAPEEEARSAERRDLLRAIVLARVELEDAAVGEPPLGIDDGAGVVDHPARLRSERRRHGELERLLAWSDGELGDRLVADRDDDVLPRHPRRATEREAERRGIRRALDRDGD